LGDTFPPVPEKYLKEIDLGENIVDELPTKEIAYDDYLFHGERYQSLIKVLALTKKGIRSLIHKVEGKGSVLDNLGAMLGFHFYFIETEKVVTFPSSVEEIVFYDDINDQEGVFEYTLLVKDISDNEVIGDMVIRRNGKVWCIANGFHNMRFEFVNDVRLTMTKPEKHILAETIAPNVLYCHNIFEKNVSWLFLSKRYLNLEERKQYDGLYPNKAREFMISRIVLKDAVRKYYADREKQSLFPYPIEISIRNDEYGKPRLIGEQFKDIEISLAHKGTEAVAIASDKPVGIDIEIIKSRSKEFMDLSFTEKELSLLEDKDQAE